MKEVHAVQYNSQKEAVTKRLIRTTMEEGVIVASPEPSSLEISCSTVPIT